MHMGHKIIKRIIGKDVTSKNFKIKNKYGVKVKGKIVPYGTEDKTEAESAAKRWGGTVVDLEAIGKKYEEQGIDVEYTYKNKR